MKKIALFILISADSRYTLKTHKILTIQNLVNQRSVFIMPRPKGSKNKAKTSSIPTADFTSLIAEKAAAKDALVSDIAALEENVNNLKNELKEKKVERRKLISTSWRTIGLTPSSWTSIITHQSLDITFTFSPEIHPGE